jgi:ubiquinone/menaquinone biosynthesis C-methylase UbiE
MNITPGYNPIIDIGIGLGNPVQYSSIKQCDSVLNLGCGFGDDAFVIRRIVGDEGKVIGIDYSIDNIAICRQNCGNFGYNNVTFFVRNIEKLLFDDATFNVVVCNYAINLMSNRNNVIKEIHRVLKSNGKLIISDFLVNKTIPSRFNNTICSKYQQISKFKLNGFPRIFTEKEYCKLFTNNNFSNIQINSERTINADDGELLLYVDYEDIDEWNKLQIKLNKIISISLKR